MNNVLERNVIYFRSAATCTTGQAGGGGGAGRRPVNMCLMVHRQGRLLPITRLFGHSTTTTYVRTERHMTSAVSRQRHRSIVRSTTNWDQLDNVLPGYHLDSVSTLNKSILKSQSFSEFLVENILFQIIWIKKKKQWLILCLSNAQEWKNNFA